MTLKITRVICKCGHFAVKRSVCHVTVGVVSYIMTVICDELVHLIISHGNAGYLHAAVIGVGFIFAYEG